MSEVSDRLDDQARKFRHLAHERLQEADDVIYLDTRPKQQADKIFTLPAIVALLGAVLVLGSFWYVGWVLAGGMQK